ncbi:MAG: response regulator transcription factor [Chloroflexi bacterium]|nr:response regulator transcription factor [Chloroflexota bacterium]
MPGEVALPIRVLLVDDHACVRQGLKSLIDAQEDLKVVGEASNGREAIDLAEKLDASVILMDITMPVLDGLVAAREIKIRRPNINILFLTVHEGDAYFFESLRAGANGYIPKSAEADEVLEGIRAVAGGSTYIQPSMAKWLVTEFLSRTVGGRSQEATDGLSAREREVLQLIAEGLTNSEVAQRLSLSINTVRRHRANLMAKLGLHDRLELVRYAISKGLVAPIT